MYNMKIIEYPNDSVQIRLYSEVIEPKEKLELKNLDVKFEKKPRNAVREPFENTWVTEVKDFDEDKVHGEENIRKSLARTRRMISEYARCAEWEWFCTFTFSPDKVDRSNFKDCMIKTRNWLQNARKRLAPDLQYLVVPELHADGINWHVHLLLANIGDIRLNESGKRISGQMVYNVKGWKFGYSTATKVRDVYRVQRYIIKYMTKSTHIKAKGAHRYYVSNNLEKPRESRLMCKYSEMEERVMEIADSLGKQIVYQKEIKGNYLDVTYIELE